MDLQLISTTEWVNHYKQLLRENRAEYMTISPKPLIINGEDINIDINTLKKAVSGLKSNRAAGPEGIPAELIKYGTDKLFEILTWCINKYLNGYLYQMSGKLHIYHPSTRKGVN